MLRSRVGLLEQYLSIISSDSEPTETTVTEKLTDDTPNQDRSGITDRSITRSIINVALSQLPLLVPADRSKFEADLAELRLDNMLIQLLSGLMEGNFMLMGSNVIGAGVVYNHIVKDRFTPLPADRSRTDEVK